MLRLIGALLLIVVGVWIGLAVRRSELQHVTALASSIALIRHARRKIDLFETPASGLFVDFSDGFDEKVRVALCEEPLETAIRPISDILGSDGAVLEKFAHELGNGYKADALRLCDYCLGVLEDRHAAAASRYGTHKKLYVALPLLFAVSVVVLLL